METHELQQFFERALMRAFREEDSISKVADALVRALSGKIQRWQINEAYDRERL